MKKNRKSAINNLVGAVLAKRASVRKRSLHIRCIRRFRKDERVESIYSSLLNKNRYIDKKNKQTLPSYRGRTFPDGWRARYVRAVDVDVNCCCCIWRALFVNASCCLVTHRHGHSFSGQHWCITSSDENQSCMWVKCPPCPQTAQRKYWPSTGWEQMTQMIMTPVGWLKGAGDWQLWSICERICVRL